MTLQRQIGFWVGSLLVFVLFLVVLRDVLLPFIAALALAYLLDPLADRLERMGMNRLAATIVILVVFLLIFVLALVLLAPRGAGVRPPGQGRCAAASSTSSRLNPSRYSTASR